MISSFYLFIYISVCVSLLAGLLRKLKGDLTGICKEG